MVTPSFFQNLSVNVVGNVFRIRICSHVSGLKIVSLVYFVVSEINILTKFR